MLEPPVLLPPYCRPSRKVWSAAPKPGERHAVQNSSIIDSCAVPLRAGQRVPQFLPPLAGPPRWQVVNRPQFRAPPISSRTRSGSRRSQEHRVNVRSDCGRANQPHPLRRTDLIVRYRASKRSTGGLRRPREHGGHSQPRRVVVARSEHCGQGVVSGSVN